jgi:hypothetical protein
MIAVVDGESERRLEIGPAASTRVARQLVHDDIAPGARELDRSGETGETGADNMHGSACHQTTP